MQQNGNDSQSAPLRVGKVENDMAAPTPRSLMVVPLEFYSFRISLLFSVTQEVMVNGIFLPSLNLLADPDYINQYISWLVSEANFLFPFCSVFCALRESLAAKMCL